MTGKTRLTRMIFASLAKALGGAPRHLTEDEVAKLSIPAQKQMLKVLRDAENKRPSMDAVMREIARRGLPR